MDSNAPGDFAAIVITAPADVSKYSLDDLLAGAESVAKQLRRLSAHRIVHARQVVHADSSTVAALIEISVRARDFGCEFAICDPPHVLDNYLDIYVPGEDHEQHICYEDKGYEGCAVPWIPPFESSEHGRLDIWKEGQVTEQYEWTPQGIRRM